MPTHTFHGLSDADFEDLACDLIGAMLGVSLQAFTKGPDAGIDLLHGARLHGGIVVQCKHYAGSQFSKLRASVAAEVPKLEKLKPSRYILVTSLGLTPRSKEVLRESLSPYCDGLHDIFGREDLNSLLRAHPEIETAHHKLWFTSAAVLRAILRNGAAVWNAMTQADIERKMSLYVQTQAYVTAMAILGKDNYCVLSGIPGIGKTTLAQIIVAKMLADGWSLIAVRNDIEEAFHELDPSRKQVVFYDDFLGQSSVGERLAKNEDRSIVRLLDAARRSERLKVVLTTREYILEDAKRLYEPLNRGDLDIAKCTVKVEDYTRGIRARILYNHIFFSGLPASYAMALLRDKGYRRIIDHVGFNPRIVEWMTGGSAQLGLRSESYVDYFIRVLDNPQELWQHAFDNQISTDSRLILYALGTVEGAVGLEELRQSWEALRSGSDAPTERRHVFRAAVKQLDGSFLTSVRARNGEIAIEFHNPSIKDFIRNRIAADAELRVDLLGKVVFFEQVECLVRLSPAGKVEAIPQGLVRADDSLRAALARTLFVASPVRRLVRNPYLGDHLERSLLNVGARFSEVAQWSAGLKSSSVLTMLSDIAEARISADEFERIATPAACHFVGYIVSPVLNARYGRLAKLLVEGIAASVDCGSSIDDWVHWTHFIKEHTELFSEEEVEAWADEARDYCLDEVDTIIENTTSSDDAEHWFGQLEDLASEWSISLESKREKMDEHIGRLGDPDGPEDSGSWRWGGSDVSGGGDDGHIDRLFESLPHKER